MNPVTLPSSPWTKPFQARPPRVSILAHVGTIRNRRGFWLVPVAATRLVAMLLATILGFMTPAAGQVPAVIYHAHANLGYVRENFVAQLDYFAANSFSTITLDQFYDWRVNDGILPYRPILLTMDDNYILGYTEMYPALAARGMVATNFTHTRGIGIGSPKASWEQVAEMDSAGVFLVEAHTQTHPRLTTVSASQVWQEVTGARVDIAANVGGKVSNHFAYPYGSYDATVIAALEAAGYKTAMTTRKGLNTRETPLFELLRWKGDGLDLPAFLAESGLGTLPPPPPGPGWILDNADPAARPEGLGWTSTTSAAAYQGKSLVATAGPSASLRWAAHLPESGTMRIHARWTATADRAPEALYTIDAVDGSHPVVVDQRLQGGQWVSLGDFSFAPGQPVVVTLAGQTGTLSADAIWFEPIATDRAPGDLVIDVAAGIRTQREAGRGWIGPEWVSLTKSGAGSLLLDRPNSLTGPVLIADGELLLADQAALAGATLIEVAAGSSLDLSGLSNGYRVPAGQTVAGVGTITGSIIFGAGSTISPGSGGGGPQIEAVPEPTVSILMAGWLAAAAALARCRRSRAGRV
jgi:autotransporter-associated beta strand protein